MAITKTTTLIRAEVYPTPEPSAAITTNAGNPCICVLEKIELDDPSDNQLPIISQKSRTILRYVEDGGAATNVSSEDSLVQSIAGAIWS